VLRCPDTTIRAIRQYFFHFWSIRHLIELRYAQNFELWPR
jgi:hypothetical protein